MAILKDLIVHGSSRFLNKIYASEILAPLIEAEAGVFKKLKADDATVVGLLDVKGLLHTNSWSNSNIATIDGSFYITPTIGSASGTVAITASSLTFSGTNYAISSLYLGDGSSINWPQYSKVLVTGLVLLNGEWIPLGTLLGQISGVATATSISISNIKDNKKPPSNTSNVYTALVNSEVSSTDYRNLKISLYQRAAGLTDFRPLGIYMTATGTNGRTFLDIYGGVESLENNANHGGFAEPNVRIGNLQGLPNVGGQTPSGWGIYTDNGYFKGIIAADRGYIGSGSRYWVIANYEDGSNSNNDRSYIYNGTNSTTSTVEGIYLGTDGIRNYKDSTHYVTIKNGVISALGVDLSGKITATSGTIGGASITNGTLIVGNANISDINASKINAGDIAAACIQTNLISAINAKVSDLSALTATIGGFQIDSSSVHTKSVAITSNADNSIALSSSDFTRIINSTSRTGLRFAIGDKFGVTGDGTVYASNVDLTGKITATSGTIGGIEIIDGALDVSSISIGNLKGAKDLSSSNLLKDVYASSLAKENASSNRYFSNASNSTITGQFIAEDNLPDPNATHFVRLTDSSASTNGRALCFYSTDAPPFVNGHTYRIGCWVRKHSGSPKMNITLGSYGSWMPAQRIIDNTDWEWVEVVHTFGDTDPNVTTQSDTYKRLYFYFYNNNVAGSSLDMCGFKMEEIPVNSGTARNFLLGTEKLTNWGTNNGTTISDGIATFPSVSSNTLREIYSAKNFKYDLIRNQYAIFSVKVKAEVGKKCLTNLCIGIDTTETAYIRKKWMNLYIYFTGTGEWQTICSAIPIFDYMFNSGSGTVDFNDCWVTVRIGAANTYHNGFQAKEPQLCLGTTATSWSRAPEDFDETIDNIEVGGRNLLKNSNVENTSLSNSAIGGTVTQTIPSGTVITLSVQVDADDVVWSSSGNKRIGVASSIIKDSDGNQYIEAWAAMTGRTGTGIDKTFDTSFHGRVKSTYTLQGELSLDKVFTLYVQSVTSGTVSVSKPKLEIGNKATDWTPAPEDTLESISSVSTVANKALNQSSWYATCSTSGGTTAKVATIIPATTAFTLTEGATVNVKFDVKNTSAVGSITLNVNETGAKNIKYINNNAISNIPGTDYIAAGRTYQFVYDGTYWVIQNLNYNTNNYDRSQYGISLYASEAISSARIAVLGLDGKLHILNSSSFSISCPLLYVETAYSASDVTKPTARASNYTYWGASFNLTNTHSIQSATANTNVYVVGILSGDVFTPSTTVLTCAEPTTENGLYYMLLGRMTSTTNAVLQAEHPIYIFKNGKFQKLEATIATGYITNIDNNGIQIHRDSLDKTDYLQINSDAISMYRADEETLRIEDNSIRIGNVNYLNLLLESNQISIKKGNTESLKIKSNEFSYFFNNGTSPFYIKQLKPDLSQTGDGTKKQFVSDSSYIVSQLLGVTINGIEQKENDDYTYSIQNGVCTVNFVSAPSNDSTIAFDYDIEYEVALKLKTVPNDPDPLSRRYVELDETCIEVLHAYVDDVDSSFTYPKGREDPEDSSSPLVEIHNSYIYLDSAPSIGATVRVVYKKQAESGFYMTLGTRNLGSDNPGLYSLTIGKNNIVTGEGSFAGGRNVNVSGEYSFAYGDGGFSDSDAVDVTSNYAGAIGKGLKVSRTGGFACGTYNTWSSFYTWAFQIGNGTGPMDRSDAFGVAENGNVYITGKLLSGVVGKNPHYLFTTEDFEVDNISVPATGGSVAAISETKIVNVAIDGYIAIGLMSFVSQTATNEGLNASCVFPYAWWLNQNYFRFSLRNTVASPAKCKIHFRILYIAADAINTSLFPSSGNV